MSYMVEAGMNIAKWRNKDYNIVLNPMRKKLK